VVIVIDSSSPHVAHDARHHRAVRELLPSTARRSPWPSATFDEAEFLGSSSRTTRMLHGAGLVGCIE
jgi:hypothetical protein